VSHNKYLPDENQYGLDPMGRARFYGIYAATVVDIKDPLKRSRIKIKINQTTGTAVTGWAIPCLPITYNANHPDHEEHTAAQIAALLTTAPTSTPDAYGNTDIPALTVVPKAGAGTLKHPHKQAVSTANKWNGSYGTVFNDAADTKEHTSHRTVPNVGQQIWVMFVAGDPEYPVWIGVQS